MGLLREGNRMRDFGKMRIETYLGDGAEVMPGHLLVGERLEGCLHLLQHQVQVLRQNWLALRIIKSETKKKATIKPRKISL